MLIRRIYIFAVVAAVLTGACLGSTIAEKKSQGKELCEMTLALPWR